MRLFTLSSALVAIVFPALSALAGEHPNDPSPLSISQCASSRASHDVQRVALGAGVYVERLQGLPAYTHLQNVRSRNPHAFEGASRSLREKGFHPTTTVYVERTVRLASTDSGPGAVGFAQQHSESSSEGEIVFWSWSDGDDNTWEGEIYVEVYSTGDASTWEGQIDSSNEDHEWVYYQQSWQKPREEIKETAGVVGSSRIVPAVISPETFHLRQQYAQADWLGWARCWRATVVLGCGTAASGCMASNGAWPACFAWWCVGAEVSGAVACYLDQ